jgi:hypothetical protein
MQIDVAQAKSKKKMTELTNLAFTYTGGCIEL